MTEYIDRVRSLLTLPVRDESHGFLDLLPPEDTQGSIATWLMQNPQLAAIYQRLWRPLFTRMFSFGGSATASADRALTQRLSQPSEWRILDVACGPGLYTHAFAAGLHGTGVCVGLDFSTAMLRRAVTDNSGPGITYVRGDAHQLPFSDNTFDVVTCMAALYLIPDPMQAMAEMLRTTKPGGEVVIFTSVHAGLFALPGNTALQRLGGFRIFTRTEITDFLRSRGCVDISQQITGQGQYVSARLPD